MQVGRDSAERLVMRCILSVTEQIEDAAGENNKGRSQDAGAQQGADALTSFSSSAATGDRTFRFSR